MMKYVEYIAVLAAIAGGLFNKWNLPGADLFVIAGLGSLAFIYGLAGTLFFKIQEKRGNSIPFVVLSSISLTIGVASLLFSHMGWDFKTLLAIVSFIALPVVIIINVYQMQQKSENPVPKMVLIRASILLLALIVF